MEVEDRLARLVPHWIEHNDSHAEQFAEWAGKAREAGLSAAADEIEAAARAMKQANERLENVRGRLPQEEGQGHG